TRRTPPGPRHRPAPPRPAPHDPVRPTDRGPFLLTNNKPIQFGAAQPTPPDRIGPVRQLNAYDNTLICRDFCSQMRRFDGFTRWYGGALLYQIGQQKRL